MIDHFFFFFLMIRRPPRSTLSSSSAASDVYKRQLKALLARLRNDISINNTPDEGVCFCAQVVLKWLECLWTNRMFPRGDAQLPGESRGEAVDVLNLLLSCTDDGTLEIEVLLQIDAAQCFLVLQEGMEVLASHHGHPTVQWCIDRLIEKIQAPKVRVLIWSLVCQPVIRGALVLSYTSACEMLLHLAQDHNTQMLAAVLDAIPGDGYDSATLLPILSETECFEALIVVHKAVSEPSKLSLIHISEPTRLLSISYAVFCLKKKKNRIISEGGTYMNTEREKDK
eukprot:TRINITY_DN10756_c0_g1_i1.p1 TRINITY_DN10756_c0_g1~~TRINITY_DN10756_c0_g1_i1.p1  ORF type:complete len:283 (-),score=78.69 TRINITY_DN10756_c0_g1_i1:30-878(-)